MGFMKMIIYDSLRSARQAARERSKAASNPFTHSSMKSFGKTAVTKSDVDHLAAKVEQTRSDIHQGLSDVHRMHMQNDEFLYQQIERLHGVVEKHGQTLKELLDVIKNVGGIG